ncbi:hypothetical protein N9N97_01305 [Rickettsiaceae bacterium]|nr:hypothetical protein [Rickettsiaceae bacterium]
MEKFIMFKGFRKQIKKAEGGIKKHGLSGAVAKEANLVVNNLEKQAEKIEGGVAKHGVEGAVVRQVSQWMDGDNAPQEPNDFSIEAAIQLSMAESAEAAKNAKINDLFESRLTMMQSVGVNPTTEQLVKIRAMAQRDVEAEEAREAQKEMAIQEEVLKKIAILNIAGVEPTPEQEVQFREIAERDLFGAPDGEEEYKQEKKVDLVGDGEWA